MLILAADVRASTQRQVQSQSTEQQIERLRAYALAQGTDLAPESIFRDDGSSGSSLQRPGLDRLRDAVASARLDRILITSPDRLARTYVHQVLLVEELQKHGATVEFLDRPMSQDPHDQLLLQIRGAVAEYERTLLTERMRRGRLRRLKAGTLLPWTRPPYGYRLDPDRPRDPAGVRIDEAAVVRDLFAWSIEGATMIALIQRLARLGIASPTGCMAWSPSALRCLLTNPAYAGQIFANRMRTSPPQTRYSALRPVGHSKGTRRPTDMAEWIAVTSVPAIINREQFDAAAARLVYNRRMAPRNNRVHQYLLRGLVSCGCCRRACTGRRLPPAYDDYLCRTKTQLRLLVPGERCPARYIPAKPLEELVWQDLCEVLQHPEVIAQAMERARGGHWLPQEWQARRENLRRGRMSLTQQIERLTEAYLGGVVPLAEFERRRRETEGRLGALERQEQELLADARDRHETARLADNAEEFCRRVRDGLASADFERKRALLELLVDRVVVTDGEVEIRYAFPTGPDGEREPFCRLRTDYLQSFRAMEPTGGVRQDLRGSGQRRPQARADHDRRPAPEGTPHRGELAQKGDAPRRIGRTKGGLNSKPHAVCDEAGRPIILLLSEGQMSDHKGARLILEALPSDSTLIADRGYDSNWFREALADKDITPCIPPTKNKAPIAYDKALDRHRHKIENMFAKLKDWRRIATRYDRCAHTFFSAICIAASVAFYLN